MSSFRRESCGGPIPGPPTPAPRNLWQTSAQVRWSQPLQEVSVSTARADSQPHDQRMATLAIVVVLPIHDPRRRNPGRPAIMAPSACSGFRFVGFRNQPCRRQVDTPDHGQSATSWRRQPGSLTSRFTRRMLTAPQTALLAARDSPLRSATPPQTGLALPV